MSIYAIGDVQGCYEELMQLLDVINFDPATDEVWFVGDLVNRGSRSLDVLRLVKSLETAATAVLGNHDLHLLALALGKDVPVEGTQLRAILDAPDGGALIEWLRYRPMVHYRPNLNTLMMHAGVIPEWHPLQVVKLGREVELVLQGPSAGDFLTAMYGERPERWSPHLQGFERLRFITNCLTRIRYCRMDGGLDFSFKGPPGKQPEGLVPWFDAPNRATECVRMVFGHWSALGLHRRENLLGLDTGCVWGNKLTAARLDGPTRIVSVPGRRQPRATG